MNFKVGDTVVCKDQGNNELITVGNEYVVAGILTGNRIKIINNNNSLCDYNSDLFMLKENISNIPNISRYIIKKDATIVFWTDGTKTIVKLNKEDAYDKRLGFLYAVFQKTSGLTRNKANKFIDNLIEEEVK